MCRIAKAAPNSLLASVAPGILSWLDKVSYAPDGYPCRWRYSSSMKRQYGVIPTGWAVQIYAILTELDCMPKSQREAILEYLQSEQDSGDGFFKDSLVDESQIVVDPVHSMKDIWGQMSSAAVRAIDLLGAEPLYPVAKEFYISSEESSNIEETLSSWNWSNPWLVGERFSRSVSALLKQGNRKAVDELFEFYESKVMNCDNGMPLEMGCDDSLVAAAGVFKILCGYNLDKRAYSKSEQVVDFILKLQNGDGSFHDNMCINWDCAWVLWTLDNRLHSAYRHDEIVESSKKLAANLMSAHKRADGGFSFFNNRSNGVHHSVIIGEELDIGDVMGTVMVLYCLFYTDFFTGALDEELCEKVNSACNFST